MPDPVGALEQVSINGRVAAAEVTGWQSDILYDATYAENFPQPILKEVFASAAEDRYGPPTQTDPDASGGTVMSWYFDLNGRQISVADTAPGNCLATRESWIGLQDVGEAKGGVGPWGCLLILTVTHDGARGLVRRYIVQAADGYAMAANHSAWRELEGLRKSIPEVQSYQPSLGGGAATAGADTQPQPVRSVAAGGSAQDLDGITIIRLTERTAATAIASGEHLVIFVSARGSYGAFLPRYDTLGGCTSLGVPGSYTGTSIAFGIDAGEPVRKVRLETYCPPFTVTLDGQDAAIISGPTGQAREAVIAHVPLETIDLRSAAFQHSDPRVCLKVL